MHKTVGVPSSLPALPAGGGRSGPKETPRGRDTPDLAGEAGVVERNLFRSQTCSSGPTSPYVRGNSSGSNNRPSRSPNHVSKSRALYLCRSSLTPDRGGRWPRPAGPPLRLFAASPSSRPPDRTRPGGTHENWVTR